MVFLLTLLFVIAVVTMLVAYTLSDDPTNSKETIGRSAFIALLSAVFAATILLYGIVSFIRMLVS